MDINAVPNQPFNTERIEGNVTGDLDVVSLGMTDGEIADAIGNRVSQAEAYWNANLNLDNVRKEADSFYYNNYYSQDDLYDFQVEYKDNRIFTAIETLVALVNSNPAMPMAIQAYDTQASYELAQQLQQALLCKYEDLYLKGQFQMIARHLLMGYRLAAMKVVWNDQVGQVLDDGSRFGDVDAFALRPHRLVLDAGAQDIDDVPLIAEYCSMPLEDMIEKYPAKEKEIKAEASKNKKNTSRVGYTEIHFTDYKTGKRREAIAWKFGSTILDSTVSPFWNYEETYQDDQGRTRQANFLSKPTKPYVLFNFLNTGKYVIDDTSLMDQAKPLQRINNKIGRQIVENAEQANAGMVINSKLVKEDDVRKMVGDPGDKLMASGTPNDAAARLPYNELPVYVREERIDARNEIDNIYGTHGAIRGETTGSDTLGQDVMSQRGDSARINVLATSIEDGSDRLYKMFTQCFKVFYDTPQLFRYSAEDSVTTFFSYGRDQIEDGVGLRVKSGSVLPEDPIAKRQETIQLMPILDPLNIAKGMGMRDPKEWAKQNMMYRLMPDRYMSEILGYDIEAGGAKDPLALQHIQLLSSGKDVPPEPNPTKEHLATHQAFLEDPNFATLPPEVQQLHKIHIEGELANSKNAMGMGEERPGMPEQTQAPEEPMGVPTEEQPMTGTPEENPMASIGGGL